MQSYGSIPHPILLPDKPLKHLPDGIDMYIAFYQDGELQKDAIKLDTENGYSFN